MRHIVLAIWLISVAMLSPLVAGVSLAATTLSQVEYDLLKVRLNSQLKKEKFDDALESIRKIKKSGYEYSPSLIYIEGYTLKKLGQLTDAKYTFLQYVEIAGNAAKYYQKSLQNIIDIDDRLDGVLQEYTSLLATPDVDINSAQVINLEKALGDRIIPVRTAYDERMRANQLAKEKRLAEQAKIAEEQARIAAEILKSPPKIGTIASIDTVWGYVVIKLNNTGSVEPADIVKIHSDNRNSIELTIKKISGVSVSATVKGGVSIVQIGADVYKW